MLPTAKIDHGATVNGRYQAVLVMLSLVQKAAPKVYRRNVPLLSTSIQHLGTSSYVSSLPGPTPTLILQATSTGVRRPGYGANYYAQA